MNVIRTALTMIGAGAVLAAPVITPIQAAPQPVDGSLQTITVDLASAETPAPEGETATAEPTATETEAPEAAPSESPSPAPPSPAPPSPAPAEPAEAATVLETPEIDVEQFTTVGVTWSETSGVAPEDLVIEVRTDDGGGWSEWAQMPQLEEGPDPDTEEGRRAVETATASLWVGESTAVQTRVQPTAQAASKATSPAEALPESLELALIDPGTSAADGQVEAEPLASADAATARPAIVSRGQWGANESWKNCGTSSNSTIKAAVIHHTAGGNSYGSKAAAMQQLRSDYSYHTNVLGWCDLGYNFVVDKWGNIYEGRSGGVDKPIVGAHAGGFNSDTFGVSMLGDYSNVTPPAAMQRAVTAITAWKLSLHDRDPSGSTRLTSAGGGTSKYGKGTTVTLPVVMGHRNVGSTACPGARGYATLGGVRANASALVVNGALIRALYQDLLGRSAEPAGFNGWASYLGTSGNRASLIRAIGSSDEYYNREINKAYQLVLKRNADRGGMDDWRATIKSGKYAYYDVATPLFASKEFYQTSGSSRDGFIRNLYRVVLKREVDHHGLTTWRRVFDSQGRHAVIRGIYQSWEGHAFRVDQLYRDILYRPSDLGGRTDWTNKAIRSGEDAARDSLINSTEYVRKALARY